MVVAKSRAHHSMRCPLSLVEKDLHVLIEDAVLTIEAIPMPEADERFNDGEATNDSNVGDPADDASATSASAMPDLSKKTDKESPKKDTVGERVLADNGLARMISAIPHLFLRDVRVRLIIRSEPPNKSDTGEPNPNDTMVEIGIDFLSVTSAEDILSHFQEQVNDDDFNYGTAEDSQRPGLTRRSSVASIDASMEHNEYLFRHIRTGKGPDAGLWIRIFVPEQNLPSTTAKPKSRGTIDIAPNNWAGESWAIATDYYLLRCSGLDIRGRVYLGAKKEVASYSWWYDDEDFDYDDETLDSMFMGVDHVAPGPQLPLPPMRPTIHRDVTPSPAKEIGLEGEYLDSEEYSELYPRADNYYRDKNGIQSCKVPSNFHRVSRGMIPGSCKECHHLPSEDCSKCWEAPSGGKHDTALDGSIPMPGLTLQITMRDPLEINADRSSLDTIGTIRSIFQKKLQVSDAGERNEDFSEESRVGADAAGLDEASEAIEPSSIFGSLMPQKETPDASMTDQNDAFSTLMQPENIQVLGIHLSEVLLRVHVMREDRNEKRYSFCYWDIEAECLTLDQQRFLPSPQSRFTDLKVEAGYLNWEEYQGTERRTFLSTGTSNPGNRGRLDSQSVASAATAEDEEDMTIWPCTASVLLNIPPPPETLIFRDRERHGLQLRLISMHPAPFGISRSLLNGRLGVAFVDAPWSISQQIGKVLGELMKSITPKKVTGMPVANAQEQPVPQETAAASKFWMAYSFQIEALDCMMEPKINAKLPFTRISGERSSEAGLFIQTIADKLRFAWGEEASSTSSELSLHQLAALPENVRMRILLCLDDIQPLEAALYLKKEENPFKRCRNVNKGIAKRAKKLAKSSRVSSEQNKPLGASGVSRRQQILKELLRFDEGELDELWSLHLKHKRKLAKRRQAGELGDLTSL